jgi:hypothetical protein
MLNLYKSTHPSSCWVLACSAVAPNSCSAAVPPLGTAAAAAATLSAVSRLGSRCLRRASLSGMAGVTRCTAPVAAAAAALAKTYSIDCSEPAVSTCCTYTEHALEKCCVIDRPAGWQGHLNRCQRFTRPMVPLPDLQGDCYKPTHLQGQHTRQSWMAHTPAPLMCCQHH